MSVLMRLLSLTKPVAEAVRRNHVEHLPRDAVPLFDVELREFLVEAVDLNSANNASRCFT